MEFWGIEIKPGEPVNCKPGVSTYLHLSQASLGAIKKDKTSENVTVFVDVDGQKLVIATLSGEKCPQISLDLVFEKNFKLSHSSKTASVYFIGYKAREDDESFPSDLEDSEEEAVELAGKPNGKPDSVVGMKAAKLELDVGEGSSKKPKVKASDSKAVKSEQEESSTDGDSDDDDELMAMSGSDTEDEEEVDSSSDDDSSSDEEAEATPKKAEITKKRAADSASKTPVPEKKAKLVSPDGSQKTGAGKKNVHTATPYPTKKVAKTTPANTDKPKPQTPKSGGSAVSCKSCSKTFNSDGALQSHTKAKHESK